MNIVIKVYLAEMTIQNQQSKFLYLNLKLVYFLFQKKDLINHLILIILEIILLLHQKIKHFN
jgi:hypothetical protein